MVPDRQRVKLNAGTAASFAPVAAIFHNPFSKHIWDKAQWLLMNALALRHMKGQSRGRDTP